MSVPAHPEIGPTAHSVKRGRSYKHTSEVSETGELRVQLNVEDENVCSAFEKIVIRNMCLK